MEMLKKKLFSSFLHQCHLYFFSFIINLKTNIHIMLIEITTIQINQPQKQKLPTRLVEISEAKNTTVERVLRT